MGLFDFFKKKKTEEQNTDSSDGILLAMPLFDDNKGYDIEKVINHLKEYWEVSVTDIQDANNETAVFSIDGIMVAVAAMPAPVPLEELNRIADFNYSWSTAKEDVKNHTNHAIVTVMSKNQPRIDQYRVFSKLLSSILMTSESFGIYQGNETLLMSRDYYLNCIHDLQSGGVPVPVWVYIGIVVNDKNEASVYTYGMKSFGKFEMEVVNSPNKTVEQLYDFMFGVASYVISRNIDLKDGETIGFTADQKIKITLSKGVCLDGKTLKFDID